MIEDNVAVSTLTQRFLQDHPDEAARQLERLSPREVAAILDGQKRLVLTRLWPQLSAYYADELLPLLSDDTLRTFLPELDPSALVWLLARQHEDVKQRCFALLSPDYVRDLQTLMQYPEGTAGHVMDPRVTAFPPQASVAEVLDVLRKRRKQNVRQVFLVDDERRLIGTVSIMELALAEKNELLGTLSKKPRGVVSPFDTEDDAAKLFAELNLDTLPVVDVNGRLLGALRHRALLKALQDDSLTDMQTMVGVGREERALSPVNLAVRKRLPWMEINLATAFLAATVVGLFEDTIARFTALAVLLPVVAGQSGNAGAQALAVTMRGLALREVTTRSWYRLMFKELGVGFFNGVVVALTTAAGVYLWSDSLGLALVISSAMVLSMIAAGMSGAVIPLLLTRFGQDPAQSSSIILTTVTDIAGFMSFLGIATLFAAFL